MQPRRRGDLPFERALHVADGAVPRAGFIDLTPSIRVRLLDGAPGDARITSRHAAAWGG